MEVISFSEMLASTCKTTWFHDPLDVRNLVSVIIIALLQTNVDVL
jgi:hypothetical protein